MLRAARIGILMGASRIVLAFCLFDILTIFGDCDYKWCELPAVRVTIDQGVIQLSLTWLEH